MDKLQSFWSRMFSWKGQVDRGFYALSGLVLFIIKWNIDRLLGAYFFDAQWMPYQYLFPGPEFAGVLLELERDTFLLLLLGSALPFIYVGVILTVKRLRSIGVPSFLAALFFVPFINLLFFAMLSFLPEKGDNGRGSEISPPSFLKRVVPQAPRANFFFSIWVSALLCLLLLVVSVQVISSYGWGLFVGIPFVLGMISVLIHCIHERRSFWQCIAVSSAACALCGVCIMLFAIEGLICLVMSMCLTVPLAILGGVVGYFMQASYYSNRVPPVLLLALLPLMGFEKWESPEPVQFAVTSTVEIDAPVETVWQNVVSFSELPPVEDWIFRTGIAYPLRAEIKGAGVGAVRHCVFSTGAFVEPITIWDEPRHLRFDVTQMPEPMEEWTFYQHIHPPHLDGYFQTTQGEFRLEPLPGGRTRLHGTTWYHNDLWPAHYWKWWSDRLIHRIHLRVLKHVKNLSERSVSSGSLN